MISKRRLTNLEQHVYMRDSSRVKVDIVRTIKLKLATNHVLELQEISRVPSIRRNLIYISLLVSQVYSSVFGNMKVELFKDFVFVGFETLYDNLYWLYLIGNDFHNSSINTIVAPIIGFKHPHDNDNSSILWHKRPSHISKQRMERLVKEEILNNNDFLDLSACVECMKGKLTSKVRETKIPRCGHVLELIHTYIYRPFHTACNRRLQIFYHIH